MAMTIVESTRAVIGGVDTHLDVHVAAAVDAVGGVLGVESFPTNEQGHRQLIEWLRALGPVLLVGVEGTGSYGAGLTRHLQKAGLEVVEVDRPNRQARLKPRRRDPLRYSTLLAIRTLGRRVLYLRAQGFSWTRFESAVPKSTGEPAAAFPKRGRCMDTCRRTAVPAGIRSSHPAMYVFCKSRPAASTTLFRDSGPTKKARPRRGEIWTTARCPR